MKKSTFRTALHSEMRRWANLASLMKDHTENLTEDNNEAAEQAHELGLTSRGKGRWYDSSGKYVAQTINGKLVQVKSNDTEYDPYENPAPGGLRQARDMKVKATDIDPQANNTATHSQDLGAIKNPTDTQKTARSTGGAGTYKGDEVPLRMSAVRTTKLDAREAHRIHADARNMLQKMGGNVDKALHRLAANKKLLMQKRDMLLKHNSNATPTRANKVAELQRYIDKLSFTEDALKGNPLPVPGSIKPPMRDNKPIEVEVEGKPGLIDFFNKDTDEVHVTFHDGSYGLFRTNDVNPLTR